MLLTNYIFGGSITARLPDRIRNQEGLSYSVNSTFASVRIKFIVPHAHA